MQSIGDHPEKTLIDHQGPRGFPGWAENEACGNIEVLGGHSEAARQNWSQLIAHAASAGEKPGSNRTRRPERTTSYRWPAFRRSAADRVLVGVCGGAAERSGIDATLVRAAVIVLTFAGGAGAFLYLAAWALSAPPAPHPQQRLRVTSSEARQVIAIACIVAGALIFLRWAGLWFGDPIVWPVGLAVLGTMVIWARTDRSQGGAYTSPLEAVLGPKVSPVRIVIGALFVIGGMALTLSTDTLASGRSSVVAPVLVTGAGLSLIFGPWLYRLAQQLTEERRERIRSDERSEMAAHLHDSVLQTLALIQRVDDPAEMSSLARVQERELRTWLFAESRHEADDLLSTAVDAMAARIETLHHVAVEAVVVGDRAMDERLMALVSACTEATTNAAKHSGTPSVSVYVEASDDQVVAYVRDSGRGFDPATVPLDRRGIAESIHARMERSGGRAEIVSMPEAGAEVRLSLPERRP